MTNPAEQLSFPPHKARTTSTRLGNHLVEWFDDFTDDEKAAVAVVRDALDRIAGAWDPTKEHHDA